MGVVYEAEPVSLGRHVALKVLPPPGPAGSSHLQRFLFEARAAARLHHSNIVPVYGVGEQDGLHYYAMQFIHGRGLDVVFAELRAGSAESDTITLAAVTGLWTGRFGGAAGTEESAAAASPVAESPPTGRGTGESGPSPPPTTVPSAPGQGPASVATASQARATYYRSAARVGRDVAEALAYAHSQGIIHRDIKPSNLLLDGAGTVWVTDFGLAKAEGADALTDPGDLVGTLRYMAPERLEGWSDPRSDVYSLGATLYELLTLHPLFDESNRGKLMKKVAHESPVGPRRLDPEIPRDLETIVLKAVAKEPARRYGSAEAMAEDLRRFLADRPILARRSSNVERLWRWSRRNPAVAGSLAASFLILAIGCAGMTVLWRRAEVQRRRADGLLALSEARRLDAETNRAEAERQRARAEAHFAKARAAVDELLTQVSESQLSSVPGLQPLRRDLLGSALAYYEDFVRQRSDDPTLKAGLAAAQLRLARIQRELGEEAKAKDTLHAAIAQHEAALRDRPDDRALRDGLAQCCVQLGVAELPSDQALRHFERAISLWEKLVRAEPANTVYLGELAYAYDLSSFLHDRNQRVAETLHDQERAFALRQAMVAARPDDPSTHNALSSSLNNLSALLDRVSRDNLLGMKVLRQAAQHSRIADAKAPQVTRYGRALMVALRNIAVGERQLGHSDEAIQAFRESLAVSQRLARENPAIPSLRRELVQDYRSIGDVLREQGRMAEAVKTYRQSRELAEALPKETADDWFHFAVLLGLCARPAVDSGAPPSDTERAECLHHADAALAALRQAIAAGFRNAETLRVCDELAAIRDRDDFQTVLVQAEAGARDPASTRGPTSTPPAETSPSQPGAPTAGARNPAESAGGGGADQRRDELASSQHVIGVVQLELGKLEDAQATLRRALAAREALVRDHPQDAADRAGLAATRVALARLDWRAGRLAAAVHSWDEIRLFLESALAERPQEAALVQGLIELETTVGYSYAEVALWNEAAEALARAVRRGSQDRLVAGSRASLLAVTGDRQALSALCTRMLDEYGRTTEARFATWVARWCALVPGSVPDAQRLVHLAEKAVAGRHREPRPLFHLSLAEYRARRFMESIRHARESLTVVKDEDKAPLGAVDAAVLAMAHYRLGQASEAARQIQVIAAIDWQAVERWPDAQDWWKRSDFLVLKREAIELVTGKPAPDDAELRRRRGRAYAQLGQTAKAQAEFQAAAAAGPHERGSR
jgi:serine/threonine-protein kinase